MVKTIKNIKIPELSMVVLVGVSGSGKSTFAKQHFVETEIISSDRCRAIVSNDENNQAATKDAFDLLHFIAAKRLKNGHLTVIDATNVQTESRKSLIALAREHHCLPVAFVLNIPEKICQARNEKRSDRNFGKHVIRQQRSQLKKSLRNLKREGFRHIHILNTVEEIAQVESIQREKLYNDKKDIQGPFDIIGDIHGCIDETILLLTELGYRIEEVAQEVNSFSYKVNHPNGRTALFLGDLVDRGPNSPAILKLVMSMVKSGIAYCVPGNHDMKLHKYLMGKKVQINHGLEETVAQLAPESEEFKNELKEFLYSLTSHYVFDQGKLVIAHAGIKEEMHGRGSGAIRSFCLYGETTGETDEFGLPVRYNWASEYRGNAMVVYGHTPVPEPQWLNKTINIDTGCVFGGKLTALKYPEEELVSVPAKRVYSEPVKPIKLDEGSSSNYHPSQQQELDDLLDINDVIGKRIISTKLRNNITIREENSIAALEVMSRFAMNPKWLIYLPPTMSPCETSDEDEYLEHPKEALNYYKKQGVSQVICEEKHMGSRAVLVVCKNELAVMERFGIENEGIGACYTRTGRNFFNDIKLEKAFLERVQAALTTSGFWEEFNTDWVCLDTELMPWSAKAQSLLKDQYASVGSSATVALQEVISNLEITQKRELTGIDDLLEGYKEKSKLITDYKNSYGNYCWPVNGINDYKLAPFHILATEGEVHLDKNHEWHMKTIQKICEADPLFMKATPCKLINLNDELQIEQAIKWWLELTEKGGEGMVVKPYNFISHGKKGLIQPAVKCRGKEYLRIIYGPEYSLAKNIKVLKNRSLGRKQSLALREFALGVESLERFIKNEPLRRIHECVFGVLALESEAVDPRL